jgi:hypothetical protein
VHAQAAAQGAAVSFVRVRGSCGEAGPATQQRLFEEERALLERR